MYHSKNLTNKSTKELFVWTIVLVVLTAIAFGDAGDGTPAAETKEAVESTALSGNSENIAIDISFNRDESIKNALRVLSAKYRKNIVPSPEVTPKSGCKTGLKT